MSLNLPDYTTLAHIAVRDFWQTRDAAFLRNSQGVRIDQGTRGAVTAGKNMAGFAGLFTQVTVANGLPASSVFIDSRLVVLPGYFRPAKRWDVVVVAHGQLVAVLEFKSQIGSIGNNINNRFEEALGAAVDFWTAFDEGAFGESTRPFLGYLMLFEASALTQRKRKLLKLPHFAPMAAFHDTSYADLYDVFCRHTVRKRLYDAAAVILSNAATGSEGSFAEISSGSSLLRLVTGFAAAVAAASAMHAPQ